MEEDPDRYLRVLLTRQERLILAELPDISTDLRQQLEGDSGHTKETWILPDEVVELRDQLADRLIRTGFDRAYEPTQVGRLLESLIDKLEM